MQKLEAHEFIISWIGISRPLWAIYLEPINKHTSKDKQIIHCQDHNKELYLDGQPDFMSILAKPQRPLEPHKHHNES